MNHTEKTHEKNLNCEYCKFIGKNVGGLRIHIRRMHSFKNGLKECKFCTFTSKTDSDLKTHVKKYNTTHSSLDYNENIEEVNCEIFAMKEVGLFLLGMQHFEDEQWTQWMHRNFWTPGKNPR